MAGNIIGRVDMRLVYPGDADDHVQQHFTAIKLWADQMVAAGHCTIHASNFGSGGTGFDYYDGANPSGENAFFVLSFGNTATPFYVLFQWASGSVFGAAPGNPGLMNGVSSTDGVGFCVAFREDGGDPWNGGSAAAGADAKGATVWTAGGSTLHVLDTSNSAGGTYATNMENTQEVVEDPQVATSRMHIIGDQDAFWIAHDEGDNGEYKFAYAGIYTPLPGVTAAYPYMMCTSGPGSPGFWDDATDVGSTAGNTGREGGIVDSGDADKRFRTRSDDPVFSTAFQPNNQKDTIALDGFPVKLVVQDAAQGWVGNIPTDLGGVCFNAANHQTDALADRAYMATATAAAKKLAMRWDQGSPPNTINDRNGRTFTVTP